MHGTLAAPPQDAELGQTLNLKGCTGVLRNCWATSRTSPTQTDWGISTSQLLIIIEEETLLMPACTFATCVKSRLLSSPWRGLVHMATVKRSPSLSQGPRSKIKNCHYTESCRWLEQLIWCCCCDTQCELFVESHLKAHWRNLTSSSYLKYFWAFLHNTQCELFVESHLEAHWRNLTSISEHFSQWMPSYACIN